MQSRLPREMYKVILLDYSMPMMSGLETARKMRTLLENSHAFQPCIVCCSAYDADPFKEEAYSAGMDKFLTKPVNAN